MPVTSREEEKTAVYLGVTLDLILDAVSLVNPKVWKQMFAIASK